MSPAGESKLLEVSLKSKSVRNAAGEIRLVLDCFRFTANQGEVCALLGPSGCGKTTLLRLISGLDKHFKGEIKLPSEAKIGMVFQEPRLLPWRTVLQNLMLAGAPSQAEAENIAKALGLAAHLNHFPQELSLGLARRASIARAFVIKPDLLLLDEPFVSLDQALAQKLREELVALVSSRQVTTLIVTHDVDEAIFLADRILIFSGAPASLMGEIRVECPRQGVNLEILDRVRAEIASMNAKARRDRP
jgi:NitT/TauT family transport system ATP-binding protein